MKYSNRKIVQSLVQLLVAKGIKHVILSPGSRNAPLIISLTSHPQIYSYSIVDERCAGFVALGMARARREPVAICCTSGSALLNYYPALSEAFYQFVPLVVISADRPQTKIDQEEGQAIRQQNVFAPHVVSSIQLSEDESPRMLSYQERKLNEGFHALIQYQQPIHINIPFSEPFYQGQEELTHQPRIIHKIAFDKMLSSAALTSFASLWNKSNRKMVLIGTLPPSAYLQEQIDALLMDPSVVVLCESTSNLFSEKSINTIDRLLFPMDDSEWSTLQPEILLTFGHHIISKKIKKHLSQSPPIYHASIHPHGTILDTYDCLTHLFETNPESFFNQFSPYIVAQTKADYQQTWHNINLSKIEKHNRYMGDCIFSDLKVMEVILKKLPLSATLHLSNSSIIRYAQLFDNPLKIPHYCNRGTSGIEGSTSTAIGYAIHTPSINILITGDISFLYDSNALWNAYTPDSFKIILLNNGGGDIFKFISGPSKSEVLDIFFVTRHGFTARHLAEMYGYDYTCVDCEQDLHIALDKHFTNTPKSILEINTQSIDNSEILVNYFEALS